ncbi:MAG: hypothetical protein GWN27_12885, partial [candidate division Zixibacteria bacterium]|nr:hypothetical protein [candidate division Zixibacteria bacterium]
NLNEHQRNIKFYREQIDKLHQENQAIDETILEMQQKKTISVQETERTLEAIKQIQAQLGVDKRDEIQ